MTERFHEELANLKMSVEEMGYLALDMLTKSIEDLKNQAPDMDWFEQKKLELEDMDEEIEVEALRLVTLHQPMAVDIRTIGCSLKMITYIARIGHYGKDIAKIGELLANKPHIGKLVSIPHMSTIVLGMIKDVLEAYETGDLSSFDSLNEKDDMADALMETIIRESITYMMEDAKTIKQCTRYTMVARYLERCGDHAVKMAEKIYYMETGERIEI